LIIGASKSGRDITERKREEEQLQRLRNENAVVLNSMNEGVHWIDIDGRIHFENPASARMLGYENSELLGRPAHATMHHSRADGTRYPQCDCPIYGTLGDGVVRRVYDDRFWRKDGTCIPVDYTCSPIVDESGRRIGAVVVFIDIAERKKAELAAIRLAAIVESSDDAIIGKDLDGMVTSWNTAAERTFGYLASEMVGQPVSRLLPPERQQEEEEILREIKRGKSVKQFETVRVRKDGTAIDVSVTVSPIKNSMGVTVGSSKVVRDITERKLLESKLRDLSHQAGMAEVASGVLHNVGNVLNSVNVSANILVNNVQTTGVADMGRLVALLREQGDNLGAFFTDDARGPKVLDFLSKLVEMFAELQASQIGEVASLQKNIDHIKDIVSMQQSYARMSGLTEKLNVTSLVEDALRINAANFQRHEVQVVREIAPELPDITTEKQKVLQILINLVSNARYACDHSGRADKQVTVRVTHSGDRVWIEVIDNGVGIPQENLTRIFTHGFTTKKDGHGFGLHNSANAAKEIGGSLAVASDGPGRGTTFTLELPIKQGRKDALST
jgi:PAS domain S-box-containing protein